MNICNFVKILITRATKDEESILYWDLATKGEIEKNEDLTKKYLTGIPKPKYDTTLSPLHRYNNYNTYINECPRLQMSYEQFRLLLPRLQKYVTTNSYWRKCNKSQDKTIFLESFSTFNWFKLPLAEEKKKHKLEDCIECFNVNPEVSILHESAHHTGHAVVNLCNNITEAIISNSPPNNTIEQEVQQFVRVLTPIASDKLNINLSNTIAKVMKLTPKKSAAVKKREQHELLKENKENISQSLISNDADVEYCLASGKSYSEYERDRLFNSHISREDAEIKVNSKPNRQSRKHHGNFNKYKFDKEKFITEMKSYKKGDEINWRQLALKYNIQNSEGKCPLNGGQVLQQFAISNGIDTTIFNINKRVSGRDYSQRVRRAKKRITKRLSVPSVRPAKHIKSIIKARIASGHIKLGSKIVQQTLKSNSIDESGNMVEKQNTVYSRKFDLVDIRKELLQEHENAGLIRIFTDDEYNNLNDDELMERYARLNMDPPENNARQILQNLERNRQLKLWHDHSDILNHTYVLFMISAIYDPANYLTNDEYKTKFPDKKPVDVASLVEHPKLYILGQSKSSDREQLLYVKDRVTDLIDLSNPIQSMNNTDIVDTLRYFSGDGPARQFESGQQRGGHYSCLCGIRAEDHQNLACAWTKTLKTLEERRQIYLKGILWYEKQGSINPFVNLKKGELEEELESRGLNTSNKTKAELVTDLQESLEGIQRPPAVMWENPKLSTKDLNIEMYEVLAAEPLHDITNVVQNLIQELPCHIQDKTVQKEYEQFCSTTIGDKNQIKGSDARLFAIRLAKFTEKLHKNGRVDKQIYHLCNSLVNIIQLCYDHHSNRCPRNILRFYNQCYVFATMCIAVIGTPTKLSTRKFYGNHFHSLTTHAPEIFRLICLRSLVPEEEERTFGDLRSISKRTSNRKPSYTVDNMVMRSRSQQKYRSVSSFQQQDSIISKQATLLEHQVDTTINITTVLKHPYRFQAHLKRIADFLLCGKGVWWTTSESSIIFLDSPDRSHTSPKGPPLHHFRSWTLDREHEYLKEKWDQCLDQIQCIPLHKIKLQDGSYKYTTAFEQEDESDAESTVTESLIQDEDIGVDQSTVIESVHVVPDEDIEHVGDYQSTVREQRQSLVQDEDGEAKDTEQHEQANTTQHEQANRIEIFAEVHINRTEMKEHVQEIEQINQHNIEDFNKRRRTNYIEEKEQEFSSKHTGQKEARNYQPAAVISAATSSRKSCKQPAAVIGISRSCKRQLFSISSQASDAKQPKPKVSLLTRIHKIVGDTTEYKDFEKYERLTKNNPSDKTFKNKYELAFAKIQMQVLKKRSDLQKKEDLTAENQTQIREIEVMLRKWNVYFY